jgi:hypothetical protein
MGFIRGLLLVFVSVILLLSVLCSGIFYTISSSLEYNTVQSHAIGVVQPLVEQLNLTQILEANHNIIAAYCKTNPDYVFNYQGYTFQFSCQDINDTTLIISDAIKNFVSNLYYQQYNCNYWDCFGKYSPPLFLISEKSQEYWLNLFYMALAASVLSIVLLFFLFRKKYDLLFFSGGVLVFSAFAILGIGKLLATLSNQLISNVAQVFFSQTNLVFLRLIIAGGVLIFAGLIVELFRAGFKIYDMFARFRRLGEEEDSEKVKQPQKKKK